MADSFKKHVLSEIDENHPFCTWMTENYDAIFVEATHEVSLLDAFTAGMIAMEKILESNVSLDGTAWTRRFDS